MSNENEEALFKNAGRAFEVGPNAFQNPMSAVPGVTKCHSCERIELSKYA